MPRFALFRDGVFKCAELFGYMLKARVLRSEVFAQCAQLRPAAYVSISSASWICCIIYMKIGLG